MLFGATRELEIFPGARLPVPSPEHLIAMKVQAIKNDPTRALQDLADIQSLLTLSAVDEEQVRGYFLKHGLADRFEALQRDRGRH